MKSLYILAHQSAKERWVGITATCPSQIFFIIHESEKSQLILSILIELVK